MSGRITDILLLQQLDIRSGIKCISKQKLEHDYLYYLSIFKVDKKRLEKYIKNASSRFNYLTKYLNKFIISGNKLPQNVSCLSLSNARVKAKQTIFIKSGMLGR